MFITKEAAEEFKALAEIEGHPDARLRLWIQSTPCGSSVSYQMALDTDAITDEDDLEFEENSVKIVCDSLSHQFLKDSIVNWNTTNGGAFEVLNPNEPKGGCGSGGCGSCDTPCGNCD